MNETVVVWQGEKPTEISVVQKSKTVWIAKGEYMDKYVEVKGPIRSSAIAHWRDAAHYRGG